MPPYGLLADLLLVAHLLFISFVIFGGLLALRWKRALLVHLPFLAWGVWIEASGGVCPLTPLENRFRRAAGEQGYATGFIEHYLVPIVYPPGLDHSIQIGLAAALLVGNAVVYGWALRRAG
jgi:hypothetical protein